MDAKEELILEIKEYDPDLDVKMRGGSYGINLMERAKAMLTPEEFHSLFKRPSSGLETACADKKLSLDELKVKRDNAFNSHDYTEFVRLCEESGYRPEGQAELEAYNQGIFLIGQEAEREIEKEKELLDMAETHDNLRRIKSFLEQANRISDCASDIPKMRRLLSSYWRHLYSEGGKNDLRKGSALYVRKMFKRRVNEAKRKIGGDK